MSNTIEIFCCYAREDQLDLEELKNHLSLLENLKLITIWSDIDINAGMAWEKEIRKHLDTAHIILLLVSAHFMASKYCYGTEMKRAMERHTNGEARVIPIIVRSIAWKGAPFDELQVLPSNAKPVTDRQSWPTRDDAFTDVTENISVVVRELALAEACKLYIKHCYEEALVIYQQLIKLESSCVPAHLGKGEVLLALARYEECLASLEDALQIDPSVANAHFYESKAVALNNLQRYEESLTAYNDAIHLKPDAVALYTEKAKVLQQLGRFPEALTAYNRLLRLEPEVAAHHAHKGELLRDLQRYKEALEAYERAIFLEPAQAEYRQKRDELLLLLQPTRSQQLSSKLSKPPASRLPAIIGNHTFRNVLLVILLVSLLSVVVYGIGFAIHAHISRPVLTSTVTPQATSTAISVTKTPDGELIGMSDGRYAFDIGSDRPDRNLKQEAANSFRSGDMNSAIASLKKAVAMDTSDAEALIYLEDLCVLKSGKPYITLVVGTMLSGINEGISNVSIGRDDLQGAYIAQREYNDPSGLPNDVFLCPGSVLPNHELVRLFIANSGNDAENATAVANQIVRAANADPSIVGVMGWPFTSQASNAINVLDKAHIPMVSETASSDNLTDRSPYFFRVVPPNNQQGFVHARYAEQQLHATNVAVFIDPNNEYSQNLAHDFEGQFGADGFSSFEEVYTVGQPESSFQGLVKDALNHNPAPDLIYFAGYAYDVCSLLVNLPTTGQFATVPVLGGEALNEQGSYNVNSSNCKTAGFHLHYTVYAYYGEWSILGLKKEPRFFEDYPAYFNPNNQPHKNPYGFTKTDNDGMLSYDAMLALLNASSTALTEKSQHPITPIDVDQALKMINDKAPLQGVSGPISFEPDGNPINKPLVFVHVDRHGFIIMDILRCFAGSCRVSASS